MAVTVVGLFVFLRSGGITAAAIVSTASYATVFVAMLVAYKAVSDTPVALVPAHARRGCVASWPRASRRPGRAR